MSSILKALRRLEEERARKSHVAPEIALSLLRGETRRQHSSLGIWLSVAALVLLILTGFFWTWRPAAVTSPTTSLTPAPATLPVASPAGRGEVIIEEVVDRRRPPLLPPVAPPRSTPAPLPGKVHPLPQPREETVATPTLANNPAPLFVEERQSPVISAIAWQDDSSARMAVVDGLPVMTGESIATARVVEILPDRILFEEGGVRFSVRLQSQ